MSDDAEEDAMEEIPMTPSPAPVEAKPPPADDDDQRPGVVVRDEEQSADATSTPAAPHEPASPPPAFTEEDLRIMEVERKRTQELYVREAELKRREKAVAVAELASPESLAQMNAERRRVAEDFRLQALAKKMQEANVRAAASTSPSSSPAAASIAAIESREMEWMERERLERRSCTNWKQPSGQGRRNTPSPRRTYCDGKRRRHRREGRWPRRCTRPRSCRRRAPCWCR